MSAPRKKALTLTSSDFFLMLLSFLRSEGIVTLHYSEQALGQGIIAALDWCEEAGVTLSFRHRAILPLMRRGFASAELYGILRFPTVTCSCLVINLPSRLAAIDYVSTILPYDDDLERLRPCGAEFLRAFEGEEL